MNTSSQKLLISVNTTWNVYNFRSGLIKRLIEEGYQITVVTPRGTGDDSRIAAMGCKHVLIDVRGRSKNPLIELYALIQYFRVLKAERPSCVLLFTIKPNLYMGLCCKLLGIPYINNITGLGVVFLKDGWLSSLVRRFYKISLSGASRVFFQNRDDQKLFVDSLIVPHSLTGLLPGSGVNLEKFTYSPADYSRNPQQPFKFILASRLLRSKGVLEYVEAARILMGRGYNVECRLLGFVDVQDLEAVQLTEVNQWAREGVIQYLGYSEDVYGHLADADCVVLPSYREGTPKVLLEAIAIGRPIITTDVPGCREVMEQGKNGYFCSARDALSLADSMERLMRLPVDELSAMGAYARRKAEQQFSEDFVAKLYLDAIKSSLRPKLLISVNTTWNVYNFRSGLIKRLIEEGYQITVVTPRGTGDDSRIAAMGCKHVLIDVRGRSKNPLIELYALIQYFRVLKAERPSCVLLFTIKPNLYMGLCCKLLGIPYINNITGLGVVFLKDGWLSSLVRRFYKISLSGASRVFFQNRDDQKLFVDSLIVPHSLTGLLPGSGVNLEKFTYSPADYSRNPQQPFKFILASRLLRSKGVLEYVEAARILMGRGYNVECRLLGFVDVQDLEAVQLTEVNQWAREGVIQYLGHSEDVYGHLADADCVVLPTFYREGTPKVLLEAIAIGRPIITTDVPGCREVMEQGKNGYFCSARDALSLADSMERLMRLPVDELSAMGAYSRQKAERQFSEEIVINRYLSAI